VCRYNPGGNKDGKPVLLPEIAAQPPKPIVGANDGASILGPALAWDPGVTGGPSIQPRLIGGDYTGSEIDDEFWAGSVGIIANLSEDTRLELGGCPVGYDSEATGFAGGIFWDPVAQVTVGAGATYVELDEPDYVDTKVERPDLSGKPELHDPAAPPLINISDCVM